MRSFFGTFAASHTFADSRISQVLFQTLSVVHVDSTSFDITLFDQLPATIEVEAIDSCLFHHLFNSSVIGRK